MHSSWISKVEKARRYAQEPERVTIHKLEAQFRGDNDVHVVTFDGDHWGCTCRFFAGHGTCEHAEAFQRMLGSLAPEDKPVEVSATA